MIKDFNEKQNLIYIVVLALIILLAPHIIRAVYHDNLLIGGEAYYDLRIAEQINDEGWIKYDQLSYGGRAYIFNPYHYLLAGAVRLVPSELGHRVLQVVAGLAFTLLFYLLLQKFRVAKQVKLFSSVALLLSPVYIMLFSKSASDGIAILLVILSFYLFVNGRKIALLFSALAALVVPFFGLIHAAALIIALFFYNKVAEKSRKKNIYYVAMPLLFVTLAYYLPVYVTSGFPVYASFAAQGIVARYFSLIGANLGFSVFMLLLAAIGFLTTWSSKKKYWFFYVGVFIFVILSIYTEQANTYLNLAFSFLAGVGFKRLARMKWELSLVKEISLIMLVCGLFFTAVYFTVSIASSEPLPGQIEGFQWLSENSDEDALVLSHYSKGFLIEYFGKRPVFMDSFYGYAPGLNERYGDLNQIFSSRNLKNTTMILEQNSVNYILIDSEMKDSIWEKEDEGLLFLLTNNETFKSTYRDTSIQIWQFRVKDD